LHVAPVAHALSNPETRTRVTEVDQWPFGILLVHSHRTHVALVRKASNRLLEMLSSFTLTRLSHHGPVSGPSVCARWPTRFHRRAAQPGRVLQPRQGLANYVQDQPRGAEAEPHMRIPGRAFSESLFFGFSKRPRVTLCPILINASCRGIVVAASRNIALQWASHWSNPSYWAERGR
jgi:hypothetical protein